MRARIWGTLSGLTALGLALIGCATGSAAKAESELTEHFTTAYGADVLSVQLHTSTDMPTLPTTYTVIDLRAHASPETFQAVLDDLASFKPSAAVYHRPVGVNANGIGVCLDDEQRAAKQALRTQLHRVGQELSGRWTCVPRSQDRGERPYTGSVADFMTDSATVRPLLSTGPEVEVTASLTGPDGRVTGPWSRVPTALADTVAVIDQDHRIVRFDLVGDRLRVEVEPTADISGTQAAADSAAHDLRVEIVTGQTDPDQHRNVDWGPVADAVRTVPGVRSVRAAGSNMARVNVATVDSVLPVRDAARRGFTDAMYLTIEVGDAANPPRYVTGRGGVGENAEAFVGILATPGVERAILREATGANDGNLGLQLTEPAVIMLPRLKPTLSEGLAVRVSGPDQEFFDLTVRDSLTAADLRTSRTTVDVAAIVDAWNAA